MKLGKLDSYFERYSCQLDENRFFLYWEYHIFAKYENIVRKRCQILFKSSSILHIDDPQ